MSVSWLRLSRRWHRWGAWIVGLVVLLWTVTGIFMVLPGPAAPREAVASERITLTDDLLSPHAALARATAGELPPIRGLELRQLDGRLVYHVWAMRGAPLLVDARSGDPVIIDDSLAVRLARSFAGVASPVARVERLERSDALYRGRLPAMRVVLATPETTVIHVAADGVTSFAAPRQRLKGIMGRLHTFSIPRVTDPRPTLRRALLIGTSVVTLALILTGFVLLLPPRRRTTADS